eukprot:g718.t1
MGFGGGRGDAGRGGGAAPLAGGAGRCGTHGGSGGGAGCGRRDAEAALLVAAAYAAAAGAERCRTHHSGTHRGAGLLAPYGSNSEQDCKECATGQYNSQQTRTSCKACQGDKFQDQQGQTSCKECGAGTYYDQGSCKNCAVGKFNDEAMQSPCKSCALGLYNDQVGQDEASDCKACADCPAGLFADVTSLAVCKHCGVGLYNDQVGQDEASDCKACAVGKYNDQAAQGAASDCKACGTGKYSDQPARGAEADCKDCPAGLFADVTSLAVCKHCGVGLYNDQVGQVAAAACKECVAGLYNDQVGQASASGCKACALGLYNDQAAQDAAEDCKGCATGRFNDQVARGAATDCKNCAVGLYNDQTGQGADCKNCAKGLYSDQAGASYCKECAVGRYNDQAAQGAAGDCKACGAGKYNDQTARGAEADCKDCAVGYFQVSAGAEQCSLCPQGKTTAAAGATAVGHFQPERGQTACTRHTDCAVGEAIMVNGTAAHDRKCTICAAGKFSDTPNTAACLSCTVGKYQTKRGSYQEKEEASFCTACGIGKSAGWWCSAENRTECGGTGFYCPGGTGLQSATKHAVAVGHYTTPEGEAYKTFRTGQRACEPGYYCERGIRLKCPSGRLCVSDAGGRTASVTLANTRVQITVQTRCPVNEFAYNGTECVRCPEEGVDCTDGTVVLKEGFWYDHSHGEIAQFLHARKQQQSGAVASGGGSEAADTGLYRCPLAERCQVEDGVLPVCLDNHGGPLCSVCDSGYYLAGHVEGCKVCPGSGETVASAIGFIVVLVLLYYCAKLWWFRFRSRYPNADLTRVTYEMPQIIKVLSLPIKRVYQVVGSFQESFYAIEWPSSYKTAVSFASAIFSFDIFGSPIFACQPSGDTAPKRFLWHTMMVCVVSLFLGGMLGAAEFKRFERLKKFRPKLWNILLPFLFIVYPSVSKTTILMLRCVNIDGTSYLLADYSVRCDLPGYAPYRGLAMFFVFVYPIGIPAFFLFLLVRKKSRLPPDWWPHDMERHEQEAFTQYRCVKGNEWVERAEWRSKIWDPFIARAHKMEMRFGFLFNAYHNQVCFPAAMSFYKLAMTTLVVFVAGGGPASTTLKILYSMFMATCLIALVGFLQPFKDADVLSVETMVQLELLFVLFAALYLQEVKGASNNVWAGLFLIALLLLPLFAVGVLLWRSVRDELRSGRLSSAMRASAASMGKGSSSGSLSRSDTAATAAEWGLEGDKKKHKGKAKSRRSTFIRNNPMHGRGKNRSKHHSRDITPGVFVAESVSNPMQGGGGGVGDSAGDGGLRAAAAGAWGGAGSEEVGRSGAGAGGAKGGRGDKGRDTLHLARGSSSQLLLSSQGSSQRMVLRTDRAGSEIMPTRQNRGQTGPGVLDI